MLYINLIIYLLKFFSSIPKTQNGKDNCFDQYWVSMKMNPKNYILIYSNFLLTLSGYT